MARFYPALEDKHRDFIAAQKLFFTATGTADSRLKVVESLAGAGK